MAIQGSSAMGVWTCPRCTLTNENDERLCSACEFARPSKKGASSGKGRVLRPRAAPALPPIVSSLADMAEPNEDDADEVDEFVPATATKRITRNMRARGRGRKGKGGGGSRNGSGSSNDSGGSGGEEEHVLAAERARSTAVPATDATSGAQRQPVELDDSDQHSDSHDGPNPVNHGDDLLAENLPLFGRGWGASASYGNSGGGRGRPVPVLAPAAGGARSTRRGKKRQRPLNSFSGDDVFRSRKYAEDEASGSDGGGQPLTVHRSVGFVEGVRRPFWRWPPAPPAHSGYAAVSGEAGKEGMAHSQRGGSFSGAAEDGYGASGAEGGGSEGGQAREDGDAEVGDVATGADSMEHLTQGLSALQSQQQGRKSQRKRSRLSLPRKHTGGECKDDKSTRGGDGGSVSVTPPTSQPVETEHLPQEPAAEGHENENNAGAPTGDACPALEETSGERATGPSRAQVEKGHFSGGDSRGAAGDRSAQKMDVDSPCGSAVGARGGATDGGSDVSRENDAEEGVSEEQGAEHQGSEPSNVTAGGSERGAQRSAQGCAHNGGEGAPGGARMDGASISLGTDTGAIASSARVPPRRGMAMDFGDDSDDDSSDGDETQSDTNRDEGVAHLGQAMDEALDRPSQECASAPPSSSPSAVPSPPAAPCRPTSPAPSPVKGTPPRRKRGGKGRARGDDSPDPSSMGLIDTPPPAANKAAGAVSAADVSTTRKLSRATREEVRLASSPGFSSAPFSQSPRRLDSPASAADGGGSMYGSRGEWKCGACTLVNRARTKKCKACGIGQPTSSNLVQGKGLGGGAGNAVDGGSGRENADTGLGSDADDWRDGLAANDPAASGENSQESNGEASGDDQDADDVSHGPDDECVGDEGETDLEDEDVAAAGVSTSRRPVGRKPRERSGGSADGESTLAGLAKGDKGRAPKGFVGDEEAILSESEEDCDDEDYEDEDRGSDQDWDESEMIASQIEEKFHRSQDGPLRSRQGTAASPRKKQRLSPTADDVLDLTEAVEEDGDTDGVVASPGAGKGTAKSGAEYSVEDISDDDEFEMGRPSRPGARARGNADGVEDDWGEAGDGRYPPTPKKFRFFSSVMEHVDQGSSCVDFSSLAAAPAGGAPGTKSYDARKRLRDSKARRGRKQGKKTKKPRATASSRGRASARGGRAGKGASGRGGRGASAGSRSAAQPFDGGRADVPSSSWIPHGVGASSVSATSVSGRRGGGSAGGTAARGQRQPFNHYRGSDEMVDDANGGGGLHWEHTGMSSFGD